MRTRIHYLLPLPTLARCKLKLVLILLIVSACSGTTSQPSGGEPPPVPDFRVMTYNIHWGVGADGSLNLQRIADVIKGINADIVVLNEVDRYFDPRSGYVDQLQWLADELDMHYQFQKTTWKDPIPASGNRPREFGHAVLANYPVQHLNERIFAANGTHFHGLLETQITIKDTPILVYATHLDVDPTSFASQVVELRQWMAEREGVKILCGDMNATPDNSSIRLLGDGLTDVFNGNERPYTFKSNNPTKRIDYIFGGGELTFANGRTINSLASDHLPVVVDVYLKD